MNEGADVSSGCNWYRWGAISNWVVTVPAIVSPSLGAWSIGLGEIGGPFTMRIWACIAFVWGCMFWAIAADPVRGRWLMKYAIIEKAITATAVTVAYCSGAVGPRCFVFVLLTDHFWIPPFLIVRSRTATGARPDGSRGTLLPAWVAAPSADRFGARWLGAAGAVSLCFAIWIFSESEGLRPWLTSPKSSPQFLVQIWAGMTALLGVALLEVAARDLRRRRPILKYCTAARVLVGASVFLAMAWGEIEWQLFVIVFLADTVWIVPLVAIDAYWRGGPSTQVAYGEQLVALRAETPDGQEKTSLTSG